MFRVFLLVLTVVGFLGCGVRGPVTQFKGATVTQSTAEAIAMRVAFDVSNTNDEPLHLMMYEYTVTANGIMVYRGKASAEQTVPRWSTVQSHIPVVIRREYLLGQENAVWELSGSLGYVASDAIAETLFKTGLWKTTSQIRAHGSVPIPTID